MKSVDQAGQMSSSSLPAGNLVSGLVAGSAGRDANQQTTETFDDVGFQKALLRILQRQGDIAEILKEIRTLAMTIPGVYGVGHVVKSGTTWDLRPSDVTGRCPRRDDFSKELGIQCQAAYDRRAMQMRVMAGELSGLMYLAPIIVLGCEPEILLVLHRSPQGGLSIRQAVEQIASTLTMIRRNLAALTNDWKLASLAAIIDLATRIELEQNFTAACRLLVNEFSRYVGCPNVGIGWMRSGQCQLIASAGETDLVRASPLAEAWQQTLNECLARRQSGRWFKDQPNGEPLLLLHRQLGAALGVEAVLSWPFETPDKTFQGAWVFAGPKDLLSSDRFSRLLQIASPRIAPALKLVDAGTRNPIPRLVEHSKSACRNRRTWLILLAMAACLGILAIPLPYQVRAPVIAQPQQRQFVCAPFEGQIESAPARVGDDVQAGQTLAVMDGRNLRWELNSILAEKERAHRTREVELSAKNVSAAILADLELQKLATQEKSLRHKLSQLEIRAPVAGVLLSASVERAEQVTVRLGETLYEIGTLHPIKFELAIPASDVALVRPGQAVRIWLEGQESQPIDCRIDRVRPVSENRSARNVFVAEAIVDNESALIRPGMVGNSRITCDAQPLGWNLFHKPWNFLRRQIAW